jgi:hypothetical protein
MRERPARLTLVEALGSQQGNRIDHQLCRPVPALTVEVISRPAGTPGKTSSDSTNRNDKRCGRQARKVDGVELVQVDRSIDHDGAR